MDKIQDNGTRMQYEGGGLRENRKGKGREDLIEPQLIFRLGAWYELGANKYGERNWEKGISVKDCTAAIIRHTFKFLAGFHDEDHLAAVAWNAAAIMRMESTPEYDRFLDLPRYRKEPVVDGTGIELQTGRGSTSDYCSDYRANGTLGSNQYSVSGRCT
jgi:hypothetical protein